jgi:hypothetical protein
VREFQKKASYYLQRVVAKRDSSVELEKFQASRLAWMLVLLSP